MVEARTAPETLPTRREVIVQAAVLVVILVALFPRVFVQGETLLPGGLLLDFPPWRSYAAEEIRPAHNEVAIEAFILFNVYYVVAAKAVDDGEWPLWNPLEFGGIPLLAGYQAAVLYPPRLLHAFLDFYEATTLFILLKLWLCGMTAYLCARYLRLGVSGARFASVAWMLCGYNVIWTYWADTDVAGWLPILLMGVEMVLDRRYRRGFFALTFGAVLLLLAGHPESAFTIGASLGFYFVMRLLVDRRRGSAVWGALAVAGAAWALALAVSMPQILPFLEYLPNSHTFLYRPGEETANQAITVGSAAALWVPKFYGTNADNNFWASGPLNYNFVGMIYAGICVWLAAPLAFFSHSSKPKRWKQLLCLGVTAGLGVLFAVNAPFLRPVQSLPVLSATWGCWYLPFPIFVLILMGAIGVERWFTEPNRIRRMLAPFAVTFAGGLLVASLYHVNAGFLSMKGYDAYVGRQVLIAGAVTVAALVLLLLPAVVRRPKLSAALFTTLLAGELCVAAHGFHETCRREHLFFDTELTEYLQSLKQPVRVNVMSAGIPTGLLQPYGIEQMWGYDGILPERMYAFLNECSGSQRERLEPLAAADFYLLDPESNAHFASDDPSRFIKISPKPIDGIEVYQQVDAFPRAYLVGRLEAVADREALLARMREPGFDPRRVCVTEEAPAGALPDAASVELGTATVVERTANRVVIETDAAEEAVLVLADAYYPGWRVWIDGEEAEVFPAYCAFRGVKVPGARHEVVFEFRSRSFQVGLWLSTGTMALSLVACVGMLAMRSGRRRGSAA